MIEVVLFDNNNASQASESHDYVAPKSLKSIGATWALDPTMLNSAAEALQSSSDYEVRHHLSWGQESQPYEKSAAYTLIERDARGYIKVYADQLLFVNIDIDYNGFRMQEKRRLKLNEKHFFDHPKFGLLMQVSRLELADDEEIDGASELPNQEDIELEDVELEDVELEDVELESSR